MAQLNGLYREGKVSLSEYESSLDELEKSVNIIPAQGADNKSTVAGNALSLGTQTPASSSIGNLGAINAPEASAIPPVSSSSPSEPDSSGRTTSDAFQPCLIAIIKKTAKSDNETDCKALNECIQHIVDLWCSGDEGEAYEDCVQMAMDKCTLD